MTGIAIGAGIDRNCELRFNLNLRSKTEMSDGAELGFLEVRLCLTSIGFVRTNV